jgi:hypothetical protein
MSARSAQARRLGREVARQLGLRRAEIHWAGRKADSFGGWRLEWTDGPTVPAMRTLVQRYAEQSPAVPVAELGYDRCRTSLAEAIALLLFIDRDRSWVDCIEIPLMLSAYDVIDWPERADQVWQDRAQALLRHTPDRGRSVVTSYAVRAFASQARIGWDHALEWLDRLVVERDELTRASNVVDLACRRDSRLTYHDGQRR